MDCTKYLQIEQPDSRAVVDFLSVMYRYTGFVVTIEVEGDEVNINVKAPHGEEESSWDEHTFTFTLPEVTPTEVDDA